MLEEAAHASQAPIVDGLIRTHDHAGQIYQIFTILDGLERFQAKAGEEAAFRNWSEAVREVLDQDPEAYFQYYDQNAYLKNQPISIDLTSGSMHYVTVLMPNTGKTLEDLKSDFPGIRMQDNTQVYDWGRVLFNVVGGNF